MANTIKI